MCMTSEQTHCTFIKIQPTWISDHSRFDFALGFESRDGFKCRPKVTTTSIPLTTTQALIDCPNLTKPNLPYGNWICSSSGKYCAFSCPSDFTKSKVCYGDLRKHILLEAAKNISSKYCSFTEKLLKQNYITKSSLLSKSSSFDCIYALSCYAKY